MLGANPSGVPDNLYPTEVYNINGDFYAQPGSDGNTLQGMLLGMELHDAYLGLTPAEIDAATPVSRRNDSRQRYSNTDHHAADRSADQCGQRNVIHRCRIEPSGRRAGPHTGSSARSAAT